MAESLEFAEAVGAEYIHAFLNGELGQLQLETVTTGGAQGGITKQTSPIAFTFPPSQSHGSSKSPTIGNKKWAGQISYA